MVHPAPLMRNEPRPNKASIFISGRQPGGAARDMLQVHGKYSSQVPEKIFHRHKNKISKMNHRRWLYAKRQLLNNVSD